jgi:hypothetical protein
VREPELLHVGDQALAEFAVGEIPVALVGHARPRPRWHS